MFCWLLLSSRTPLSCVFLYMQVMVGTIVPGGAADLDGRLQVGDEIVEINGQSCMNETHRNVVSLMGTAGLHGRVGLGIRRKSSQSGKKTRTYSARKFH